MADRTPRERLSTRRSLLAAAGGAAMLTATVTGCDLLSTTPDDDERTPTDRDARESPTLAKRVDAGELPPLQERLPDDPVVVEPLRQVGRYGGTLRNTAPGAGALSDIHCAMVPGFFRFSDDLSVRTPELAHSVEMDDDFRRCVLRLRPGIRWSDGEPFTADDVIFYFDDWQFDEGLSPVVAAHWIQGGERMGVSKLDRYAVQFDFAVSNPAFALLQFSSPPLVAYAPAHFLRQFHPRYNSEAARKAEEEGYQNWQDQFLHFAEWGGLQDPRRPDLAPWIPVANENARQRYARNPYYWKVDPDGRQLPYIDEVVTDFDSDMQATQLRVQSGAVTIAGLNLLLPNYPVLKDSEQQGGYRAVLLPNENGSDVGLAINQEHPDPVLRQIFQDVRFRQAVSVAINREQIDQVVFFGQGTPRQATINESASFFRRSWAEHHARYDRGRAEELLDEMGLRRGGGPYRLRPDGRPLFFQIEFSPIEGPKTAVLELVVDDLRAVGMNVRATARSDSYMNVLMQTSKFDVSGWQVNRSLERAAWAQATTTSKFRPGGSDLLTYAIQWRTWFESNGQEGVEPPSEAKDLEQALHEWQRHDFGTPEYAEAGVAVFDLVADTLWLIGTVGQGPNPVVVSSDLENVFDDAVFSGEEQPWWGAAPWFWHPHRAEQWFFTE